jgi:hypothetical protein
MQNIDGANNPRQFQKAEGGKVVKTNKYTNDNSAASDVPDVIWFTNKGGFGVGSFKSDSLNFCVIKQLPVGVYNLTWYHVRSTAEFSQPLSNLSQIFYVSKTIPASGIYP